jgi:HK97 family phage major capsid protein/HK97 family phage prohead protease
MTKPQDRPQTKPSSLCLRSVEFRAAGDHSDGRTLEGYAAVFDVATRIDSWEGTFDEIIAKGAFKRTLNARTPVLQFDHGRDVRTGSVPIGSIQEIREDDHGLFISARLFDNNVVEPIRQAIEGNAITGMSFRFRVVRDEWRDNTGKVVKAEELLDLLWDPGDRGPLVRTIKEVELFEAGPVVFPAYDATTVGVRSLLADLPTTEREALLRDLANELRQPAPEPDPPVTPEPVDAPSDPASRHSDPPAAPAAPKEPAAPGTSATADAERNAAIMEETMTVEEREARQSEIKARLTEIDTEYNGAALPEEARAEWDGLNTELDANERAIADAMDRRERLRALAENPAATEQVNNRRAGYGTPVRSGGSNRRPDNIYDLSQIRQEARSLDDLPQLYRDNAMRAIEQARFPGAEDRSVAQGQAERVLNTVADKNGELARRFLVTGSPVYERAFGKYCMALSTNGLTTEEQRALAVGAGQTGGFAVPFQLDPTIILTNNGSVNPLRQMARVEQITGKEWDGVTSAGVTVSRAAEAEEADDNSPDLQQPTVKAERVQGFIPFSREIDQDWGSLQAQMTRLLAEAKDDEEADSFVNGSGVAPAANGLITTLSASSNVTANTFTVGSIYALEDALPDRFLDNAQFLAHRSIYNLARQFDTAGGANLWVRLGEGLPPELIGYPARRTSAMPDGTLQVGDRYLLLGDFRNFLIVDRIGMNVDVIPHLFGPNRRPTGQRGLYAFWRNNSKVLVDNAFRVLHKAA